eukprot:Seg5341.1 transcript_id=Seg5341.1/GoldUCD/mRNA.D3Y31 product="hypothetical protein" protein_id=Seg5341.1/GoldUCD/D3Y31
MTRPKFEVSPRSVREHFQGLYDRLKAKNREEECASGITPDELSEIEVMIEELIDLFESAAVDQKAADKEKTDRAAADIAKARDMRLQSLETFAETRKRKNVGEGEGSGKRARNSGKDTLTFLQDKLKVDAEFRRQEMELRERELAERARLREIKEQQERERNVGNGEEGNVARAMENMQQHMQQQNQIMMQMLQQQQQQGQMMMAMFQLFNNNKKD